MSVSDILNKAADLIEPEGAWIQGAYAGDSSGVKGYWPTDPDATCFCMWGAIIRATGETNEYAWEALSKVDCLGGSFETFNDAKDRTQSEVVAALRTASIKASQ